MLLNIVSLPTTTKQDIKNLHVTFKAKYDAPSSEHTYHQQVHDLQCVNNEPLSEFAYCVENFVNKAYPSSQEKESCILDAYVAGVDKKLAQNTMKLKGKKLMVQLCHFINLSHFFERFELIWKIPHDSQVCGAQVPLNTPAQLDKLTRQICALQVQVASLNT